MSRKSLKHMPVTSSPLYLLMAFIMGGFVILSGAQAQASEPVSLDWVLDEVPRSHETWEITEMQIRQSQATRREVLASLLPQLNLSAGLTRQDGQRAFVDGQPVERNFDWNINTTASITVFNGPRYFDLWQADSLLEATQYRAQWIRHLLLLEAELAFYTLAAAQREVEIAEAAIAWRQQYLEQAQALVDAGMAVAVDISRARAQVLEAEQAFLEARIIRGNAADGLATLLGRSPDGSMRVEFDAETVVPDVPAETEAVTEQRFDFGGRRATIEATEMGRRAIWWSLAPTVSFNVISRLGPTSDFNPDRHNWGMGLSLNWNLYDGGARYARADAAQARIREQELEMERDLRDATVEVEQALRQWRLASAAIGLAEERLEVTRETFEMVSTRFEAGLATSLEVSDASQELLNAELRLNQVRLQARLAEVRFRYLDGLGE